MILAAILNFVEEAEKRPKKFTGQISMGQYAYWKYLEKFQERNVWLYYQILMMAKMSKTEMIKRKKSKVFIIRITPKAFQLTSRVRSFL